MNVDPSGTSTHIVLEGVERIAVQGLPEPDPAPWGLKGALLLPVMAFGGQLLLVVLVSPFVAAILLALDPTLGDAPDQLARAVLQVSILPVAFASSLFTIGLLYASVTLLSGRPFLQALHLKRPSVTSIVFLGGGAVVAMSYAVVGFAFPPSDIEKTPGPLTDLALSGPLGHIIWVILVIVMAPMVEEMLFRGYVYLGACRMIGPVGAGIGVTVVFVLMHLGETGTYWPALASIGTVALLLILVMQRTRNLTHCIACHLGYNGALAVLSFLGG